MIRHKNEIEDLLLSITKNCETPIDQTHTQPEQTHEFKLTKSRKTFSFKSPNNLDCNWMI